MIMFVLDRINYYKYLLSPETDAGGDIAAGGVPLDVCAHEVLLRGRRDGHVGRVDKLE